MSIPEALAKMGEKPSGDTMPREAVELLAACVEQNARDSFYVTNQLMEGYEEERDDARAELAAIRDHVSGLLAGPYMPTPDRLLQALWPSKATVDQYRSPVRAIRTAAEEARG